MALNTNTSRSVQKASTVLGEKAKKTAENMDKLLKQAGCTGTMQKTTVPIIRNPGDKDDIVFIGLNGVPFYFQRGQSVAMPEPLLEIALSCGIVDKAYLPAEAKKE